jgi:hypothetical protein
MTVKNPDEAKGNSTRSHLPSNYRQEEQATMSVSLRPSRRPAVRRWLLAIRYKANGWPLMPSGSKFATFHWVF